MAYHKKSTKLNINKKISTVLHRLFRSQRSGMIFAACAVAVLGTITLLASHADTPAVFPTDPNAVVVQYANSHANMTKSTSTLPTPVVPAFTLYGNGLLVCGHSSTMPFMIGMDAAHMMDNAGTQPTATTLSADDMQQLAKQVIDTGFLNLNPEYFYQPVAEKQDILRFNLATGDHYVLYYNDVPAPAAYSQTLSILEKTCSKATDPYFASSVLVRTKKNPVAQGHTFENTDSINPNAKGLIQANLRHADNPRQYAKTVTQRPTTVSDETNTVVTGDEAKSLITSFNAKSQKFINDGGASYQMSIEQQLPTPSNPLHVDYAAIRAKKAAGVTGFIKRQLLPTAHAQSGPLPLRVVYLIPTDGGDTSKLATAQTMGQQYHDWYCQAVGRCYTYQGVVTLKGNLSKAQYMACPPSPAACDPDQLNNTLKNMQVSDAGTIFRPDVDTLVVTSWQTNALTLSHCGWGMQGDNLGVIDGFAPSPTSPTRLANGDYLFCVPGAAAAHESGHTFGLAHSGSGTLMDGPPYAQTAPQCDVISGSTWITKDGTVGDIPRCTLDPYQTTLLQGLTNIFTTAYTPPPPTTTTPPPTTTTTTTTPTPINSTGIVDFLTYKTSATSANLIGGVSIVTAAGASGNNCAPISGTSSGVTNGPNPYGHIRMICPATGSGTSYKFVSADRANYVVSSVSPKSPGSLFTVFANKTTTMSVVMMPPGYVDFVAYKDSTGGALMGGVTITTDKSSSTGLTCSPVSGTTSGAATTSTTTYGHVTLACPAGSYVAADGTNFRSFKFLNATRDGYKLSAGSPHPAGDSFRVQSDKTTTFSIAMSSTTTSTTTTTSSGSTSTSTSTGTTTAPAPAPFILTGDGPPAIGRNADGRLEMFSKGLDGVLWHKWQLSTGGWSSWASLGGTITTAPTVARNADGRLEIFARGGDNGLYHKWQLSPGGGWSGWAAEGGGLSSGIAVAANADGRLEVFIRGTDNALYHKWQTSPGGAFSAWLGEGGAMLSIPAVGRNADGRLEVFIRGTDNQMYHKWQNYPGGPFSDYGAEGGSLAGDIAVGVNPDGRMELFMQGTDNVLYHKWQIYPNAGWSGWGSLGAYITSPPAVGNNADGHLEVYVRGYDNQFYHKWQSGGGWTDYYVEPGLTFSSRPVMVQNADGRLEVFGLDANGHDAHKYQFVPNGGWSGWADLSADQ